MSSSPRAGAPAARSPGSSGRSEGDSGASWRSSRSGEPGEPRRVEHGARAGPSRRRPGGSTAHVSLSARRDRPVSAAPRKREGPPRPPRKRRRSARRAAASTSSMPRAPSSSSQMQRPTPFSAKMARRSATLRRIGHEDLLAGDLAEDDPLPPGVDDLSRLLPCARGPCGDDNTGPREFAAGRAAPRVAAYTREVTSAPRARGRSPLPRAQHAPPAPLRAGGPGASTGRTSRSRSAPSPAPLASSSRWPATTSRPRGATSTGRARSRRGPLGRASLGAFFELALGLTAWKEHGGARWALRANPSSGNLHPTEGYVLVAGRTASPRASTTT